MQLIADEQETGIGPTRRPAARCMVRGEYLACVRKGGALTVRLRGDAGLVEADGLRRGFSRLRATRPEAVTVDLSGVTFLSGAAMGALLAFKRGVEADGGAVRIVAVPPKILHVLRAIRLDGPLGVAGHPPADTPPGRLPVRT